MTIRLLTQSYVRDSPLATASFHLKGRFWAHKLVCYSHFVLQSLYQGNNVSGHVIGFVSVLRFVG